MHILLPGPTPIPPTVQEALVRPMNDHRGTPFTEVNNRVRSELANLFNAPSLNHIAIFPASGTGGLEAAVVNFCRPHDRVLSIETGLFGRRFGEVALAHQVQVDHIKVPWGKSFEVPEVIDRLNHFPYRAVLVTHNETSTGVVNPVVTLAEALVRTAPESRPILLVDSISGVPSMPLFLTGGVDVIIAASQKGFMCPPGLALLALSDRARAAVIDNDRPGRFYFDLRPYLADQLPYTPAVGLWHALDAALTLLRQEGAETRYRRHRILRDAVRAFAKAGGLTLLVEEPVASPTVTALALPDSIEAGTLRENLERVGLQIAGAPGPWHHKAIRIGHVGYLDLADVVAGLGLIAPYLPDPAGAMTALIPFLKEGLAYDASTDFSDRIARP